MRPRILIFVALALMGATSSAHEIRPAFLQFVEIAPGYFDVTWKVPARGDAVLNLTPVFPSGFEDLTPRVSEETGDARILRWRIRSDPSQGEQQRVVIEGLRNTLIDVLVSFTLVDGTARSVMLNGASPDFLFAHEDGTDAASGYFRLGIQHILLGVDHLLFVLTILLLLSDPMRVVKTITSFTVAHSVTLAMSTMGVVRVPVGPIEVLIAASIVFVAAEALRVAEGPVTLAARKPWLIAFIFGLLHGFGFAGALTRIGLPQTNIPMALLKFNLGVEAGQILFLAFAGGLLYLAGLITSPAVNIRIRRAVCYTSGIMATFWLYQRLEIFVTPPL